MAGLKIRFVGKKNKVKIKYLKTQWESCCIFNHLSVLNGVFVLSRQTIQRHHLHNDRREIFSGKRCFFLWKCVFEWFDLNNAHVIRAAAGRGHLAVAAECVIIAARRQRLACRHTPLAPQRVSLITASTHTHTHLHRHTLCFLLKPRLKIGSSNC